jgi:hypothetical protein
MADPGPLLERVGERIAARLLAETPSRGAAARAGAADAANNDPHTTGEADPAAARLP